MKPMLAWIKSHLLVVISTVVVLVVLPVGYVFSSKWNESIKTKRAAEVKADLDKLNQKVAYAIPTLDPTEPAVTQNDVPNAMRTEFFRKHREAVLKQAEGVVTRAVEFNQRAHRPLVEGLFPDAKGEALQTLPFELADRLIGLEGRPSVFQELLDRSRAGGPRAADKLAPILMDVETREREAILGQNANRPLTADENKRIVEKVVARRLGEYQARARELAFFASIDAFQVDTARGLSLLRVKPKMLPNLDECFAWQADYWLFSDVIAALAAANSDSGGRPLTVDQGAVKRLVRVLIKDSPYVKVERAARNPGEETTEAPAAASPDAEIKPDFAKSITGRWAGPSNGMYDIRRVTVDLIVDSAMIPRLFDAFAQTNFMTITDIDLAELDPWAELERGYFYGDSPVVKATIEVETVWLRSWMKPWFPKGIRAQLGIPDDKPAEGENAAPTEGEKKNEP
ncbi:MAG: hypothetical protein IT434_03560 [Phycisphaerales bacterium]|nr:hypothetical protein [Phycisphaerales bacterium]